MPLQKQVIQLPYGGLQTKVDPKMAPLGTYAIMDNWVMNRYPELVKRNGLKNIGVTTVPSNITTNYTYLNETGVITNNSLYSYSSILDQYLVKGYTASPLVTQKPIISNTYSQSVCDTSITANSILGTIWEDSRGGIRYSVKDLVTDSFIVSDIQLSATGIKPKTIATKNFIYFLWCENNTTSLNIIQYNTLNNTLSNTTQINTIMSSTYVFDCTILGGNILIAALTTVSAPGAVIGYYWNTSLNAIGQASNGLPGVTSLAFTNADTASTCLSLATPSGSSYFICSVFNSSKFVYTKPFNVALAGLQTELKINTIATTDNGYGLSSCCDSNNNTYLFYSTLNTIHNSFLAQISANVTTQTITSNAIFINQMGIASKAFYYSGNAYVILSYLSASGLQNTYFGIRNDGATWGRFFATLGSGVAKANSPSSITLRPDKTNTYICGLLKTTQIIASANSFYSATSVYTEQINFTPASIDNKVLGQYLNIAGGYLKQYDGSAVFEQGFHTYPEKPTLTSSNSGGGMTNSGVYSYIAVWEWTDNQGQVHRSNTSVPSGITLGASDNTTNVVVRTLPLTDKQTRFNSTRTAVVLAVYRTVNGGTNYYRVNQLPSTYIYNNSTLQTLTFVDSVSDITLQSNSLLYTTGGVFDNIATPACNLLAVAKNRVIMAGSDSQPNQVYISHQLQSGKAVEFANELSVIVDGYGGPITAIAAMDDKILIFKQSLLYYIAGEGPDPTGNNGSFTVPLLVSADCGCSNPQSIVLTGLGVMFLSPKGIYLCDRNLNVTYIGQAVDAITTLQPNFAITSAINLPDRNLVYFTTNGSQVLTYNTFFQQWFTHTLPCNPISSTISSNVWYSSSSSSSYQEVVGQPYDNGGKSIKSTIQTNWISLAQVEGFSRIYSIIILGDNATLDHRLVAELYYDFEIYPREILYIDPLLLQGNAYGTGATYGSDKVYGGVSANGQGSDGTYQFIIRPREQKCSSIQIKLYDQFPDGNVTASFKFSGFTLVAGIKSGWNKNISSTRRLT